MTRRLILGVGLACLMATGGARLSTGWNPLCVLYPWPDPMYIILACWIDPPPPHPEG